MAAGRKRVEIRNSRLVLAPPHQQSVEVALRIDMARLLHKGFLRVDAQQVLLGAQRAPNNTTLTHRIGLPDHKQARLRRLDGNGTRRPRRILGQAQRDAYRERLARAQSRILLARGIGPRVDTKVRKRGELVLGAGKVVQADVIAPVDIHGAEQRPGIEQLPIVDCIHHGLNLYLVGINRSSRTVKLRKERCISHRSTLLGRGIPKKILIGIGR